MVTGVVAPPPLFDAVTICFSAGHRITLGHPEIAHVALLSTRPSGSAGLMEQNVVAAYGPAEFTASTSAMHESCVKVSVDGAYDTTGATAIARISTVMLTLPPLLVAVTV
jgi:hypothetical protein